MKKNISPNTMFFDSYFNEPLAAAECLEILHPFNAFMHNNSTKWGRCWKPSIPSNLCKSSQSFINTLYSISHMFHAMYVQININPLWCSLHASDAQVLKSEKPDINQKSQPSKNSQNSVWFCSGNPENQHKTRGQTCRLEKSHTR